MNAQEHELKALMLLGMMGDTAAQRLLLESCAHLLRSYFARRLSGREADVEDLVQETLIALHERRASFDVTRSFSAWFHAIAQYKLMDHLRRVYRRQATMVPDTDCDVLVDGAPDPGVALDLARLLDQLPAKQRDLIRFTRIEGLSTAEAAERTGASMSSVKVGVHRGLRTLMREVKNMDDVDGDE